jgi:hypothetical protein
MTTGPTIVGFTGTRQGMISTQSLTVRAKLMELFWKGAEFHHGVCIGADVQAARMARALGYRTIGHPPILRSMMAVGWTDDETRAPKEFIARNRDIVDACAVLIAAPHERIEQPKGGTWYTYRYAQSVQRKILLVVP